MSYRPQAFGPGLMGRPGPFLFCAGLPKQTSLSSLKKYGPTGPSGRVRRRPAPARSTSPAGAKTRLIYKSEFTFTLPMGRSISRNETPAWRAGLHRPAGTPHRHKGIRKPTEGRFGGRRSARGCNSCRLGPEPNGRSHLPTRPGDLRADDSGQTGDRASMIGGPGRRHDALPLPASFHPQRTSVSIASEDGRVGTARDKDGGMAGAKC
jgi:hypothetical protein